MSRIKRTDMFTNHPGNSPPSRSAPQQIPPNRTFRAPRRLPAFPLILLALAAPPILTAQNPAAPAAPADQTAPADPVTITALTFQVENGRTSEKALRRFTAVTEGSRFDSIKAARAAVDRDIQELINLRVFRSVDAELKPAEGGHPNYSLTYRIVDAFTFIPIPLVLYSSNAGGPQILYIQIWDNMFGSLINWFSIVNITLRDNKAGGVETGPWLFSPRISNIKTGPLNLSFGLRQERVESARLSGLTRVSSYRYDLSALDAQLETRFGPNRRLYYTVGPLIELRYSYTDFINRGGFTRSPLSFGIKQSFFYDSTDVFFNSRKGIRTGLTGTFRIIQTDGRWRPVFETFAEAGLYLAFDKRGRFSYYPRLALFSIFNDTAEKLGEPIRGIPDASMDGRFALYLNQTLGIGLWQWKGVWDLQLHPWFDLAFAAGGTRPFKSPNDIRRALGADLLLFIERVPNLVFRFTWGFDLDPAVPWNQRNKREFIVRYSYSY